MKNKHDPAKQLKKVGTVGQESIEFGTICRKPNRLSRSTLYSLNKKQLNGKINKREDTALCSENIGTETNTKMKHPYN